MVTKEKKYDFYSSTLHNGVTLNSIRALKDIPRANIKKGDIGGWIESESNLDQYDDSWIFGDAMVYGKAKVINNSYVFGTARVYGNALINNSAVSGSAIVSGNAVINNSEVCSDAVVWDDAVVTGSTIKDHVEVCSDAVVTNCDIDGKIHIDSNTDTSEFKKLNVILKPSVRQQYTLTEDEEDLIEYIINSTFFNDVYRFSTKKYHITTKYQDDTEFDMWMSKLYTNSNSDANTVTDVYMLKLMVNDLEELEECGLSKCSTKVCRSNTISIERNINIKTCETSYRMRAPFLNAARASDDDYMDDFRKVLEAYADVFKYKERRKKQ